MQLVSCYTYTVGEATSKVFGVFYMSMKDWKYIIIAKVRFINNTFRNSFTVSLVAALSVVDKTLLLIQNLYHRSNKSRVFRQKQRDICCSKYCALISIMNGKDVKQFLGVGVAQSWRRAVGECDNLKSLSCLVLSTVCCDPWSWLVELALSTRPQSV